MASLASYTTLYVTAVGLNGEPDLKHIAAVRWDPGSLDPEESSLADFVRWLDRGAAGGPFFGVRSLVNDTIARRTDGYIYGVIVSGQVMGRGLMPVYGDKVRGTDRWDLVNYVRTLQAEAKAARARR